MRADSGTHLPIWILLLALVVCDGGAVMAAAVPVTDRVAEVNGIPILRRSFQIDYRKAVEAHAQKGNPVNEAYLRDLRSRLIDYLIETELLLQDAAQRGIAIAPQELDQAVAAARAAFANEDQFRAHIRKTGMRLADYRERLRRELTIKKLIATHIAPDVTVSDQEIQAYYLKNADHFHLPERLHLRHITLRLPPDADASQKSDVRERILSIQHQLASGSDFAQLAQQFSEDPSRKKGGDIGFLDAGQASRKFGPKVLERPTGQVSEPLETPLGIHLVSIEARQPPRKIPLASVREAIRQQLYRQKTRAPIRDYVKTLRQKAEIAIFN